MQKNPGTPLDRGEVSLQNGITKARYREVRDGFVDDKGYYRENSYDVMEELFGITLEKDGKMIEITPHLFYDDELSMEYTIKK